MRTRLSHTIWADSPKRARCRVAASSSSRSVANSGSAAAVSVFGASDGGMADCVMVRTVPSSVTLLAQEGQPGAVLGRGAHRGQQEAEGGDAEDREDRRGRG